MSVKNAIKHQVLKSLACGLHLTSSEILKSLHSLNDGTTIACLNQFANVDRHEILRILEEMAKDGLVTRHRRDKKQAYIYWIDEVNIERKTFTVHVAPC